MSMAQTCGIPYTKIANQTKTSTTTLAADTTLQFAAETGSSYAIRLTVMYDNVGSNNPGIRFSVTGPATTSVNLLRTSMLAGATTDALLGSRGYIGSTTLASTLADVPGIIIINGVIVTSAAGTISFQWAQGTSNANATTVFAGSTLEWKKLVVPPV